MNKFSQYVGLDTHKETIAVAIADAQGGKPRYYGEIANTPEAIRKLIKKLCNNGERLSFCYEAGPCGYEIYRRISQLGQHCSVVAPSLICFVTVVFMTPAKAAGLTPRKGVRFILSRLAKAKGSGSFCHVLGLLYHY